MATKIRKISKSSKRAPAKKRSFLKNRFAIVATLLIVLGLGVWGLMRSMTVPSDINLVATNETQGKLVTDAAGCYYQPVQCVKAPCEPIKVCPTTTTPNGTIPLGCTSWFDGCNTCTVKNGVIAGCTKMACKLDPNNPPKPYCMTYGENVPVPVPTSVPEPVICAQDMYTCPSGAMVRRTGLKCEFVCPSVAPTPTSIPSPSPTPTQNLVTITNFNASTPCGVSHFKNYQFTCSLGAKHTINDNTCINLVDAVKRAKDLCQTNPK